MALEHERSQGRPRVRPPSVPTRGPRVLAGTELDREAARLLRSFCRREQPNTFRMLFETTGARLLPMLRLLLNRMHCPADPWEILADTFAQVYHVRHAFARRPDGSFVRWFFSIARNLLRQRMREALRRDRRERHVAREEHDLTTNPFHCMVRQEVESQARRTCLEIRHLVLQSIERLSPGYQQVLLLHSLHRLRYGDIARRLGITPSAVAMRMKRARERILSDVLDRLEGPPEHGEAGAPARRDLGEVS